MSRIEIKVETDIEKVILGYLEENASDVLAEKINSGKKTLADCITYITSEAKKQAQKGCAMVEDKVVFGWAVHYFEEDSIKAEQKPVPAKIQTSQPKPEQKPVVKKPTKVYKDQLEGQTSIFDFLGV